MATLINRALPPPKQIRFVHNQGQPPSKRRRINAACLTCRKRKTRCAGERPVCSTCTKNGHSCLGYNEVEKRRLPGVPGGGPGAGRTADGDDMHDDDALLDEDDDDEIDDEQRHAKSKVGRGCFRAAAGGDPDDGASRARRNSEFGGGGARNCGGKAGGGGGAVGSRGSSNDQDANYGGRPGRSNRPRNASQSEGTRSSHSSRSPMQRHTESRRVPYFRYFGPTAIVPGFKQMVVSVRDRRRSVGGGGGGGSFSAPSPGGGPAGGPGGGHVGFLDTARTAAHHHAQADGDVAAVEDLPIYDPNDAGPVPPLILSLVRTFFHHLGCNYPFLKEDKFYVLVKEKRVEPILVDAVCALAARFSDATIFTSGSQGRVAKSEFGSFYAQRAKSATVDTFPCPSVGAVQACLLMAYEGFGANQDSALWMYLGLAIRMAVDLGLQKMVGVKYQGDKDPWYTRHWSGSAPDVEEEIKVTEDGLSPGEQREVEQERIDTFWAVFTLDRVISSGTGRPVTFRDDDFELALPEPLLDASTGWPDPYPHFIRIIHLYGRVSDVLNNIRNARDLTNDKWNKLSMTENELTLQHQALDPRLEFNARNFRAYVDAGKATTFILLHFWFHALIIILHQPTLLSPFGSLSRTHQLLPNSRELSMSSAKTIADILAFAELIDPKSFIGNPFTSQPMYIAACAFLLESVANASEPASPREDMATSGSSLKHEHHHHQGSGGPSHRPGSMPRHGHSNSRSSAKHPLLASAANQDYQRCHNSLAQLHTYWGGVRYILTALDQKSEGVQDVETYTHEEYESTKLPPRRGSIGGRFPHFDNNNPSSPNMPPIAWSLTGTTNSPNSNLTLMYQNMGGGGGAPQSAQSMQQQHPHSHQHHQHQHQNQHQHQHQHPPPPSAATPPGNMIYDPIRQSLPEAATSMFPPSSYPQPNTSAIRHSPMPPAGGSKGRRLSTLSVSSMHKGGPGQGGGGATSAAAGGKSAMRGGLPPDEVTTPPPQSVDQASKMHMLVPQTFTPSSQHSSGYEPSLMPSASPASTHTMGDAGHHNGGGGGSGQQRQQQQQQQQTPTTGPYASNDAMTSGMQHHHHHHQHHGLPISYGGPLGAHQITDGITFDSQEIDIGTLGLQHEMMPSWLEYLPVMGLFDNTGMHAGA